MVSGSLPGGLSLDSSIGEITGTPKTSGSFTLTFQVTDPLGRGVAARISSWLSISSFTRSLQTAPEKKLLLAGGLVYIIPSSWFGTNTPLAYS
ncbi:hypothetical protein EPO44_00250 [bacterium]|nr:MAG: hypothetical protein EPO44_00250 [bacterium]